MLDLMIRHSTAAHKRETIAWAKRRQASIEKLTILQVWRNYVKKRFENGPDQTPATLLGLSRRPLKIQDILSRRLFFGRIPLPKRWQSYYRRWVVTPVITVNRTHDLSYAL